jgi:FAD/FMN-containing dehydrogenase
VRAELSRRSLLKGIAAGVTVVGWSALDRAWVPAGASEAARAGATPLPPLDGTVEMSPAALAAFAGDFGRLVTGTPTAVLRPGSVKDIVKMVRYARRSGLTIAMNGQSGTDDDVESHSNFGQALVPGGIAIDARSLRTIHRIDRRGADVDAGVTWSELDDAAAPSGRTPPMLTDFVHLSIGGTLSVGGTGGTMQKVGAQVDTVQALEVVTGAGKRIECSPEHRPDVFDAVLAGAGQCAIIVRAKLALAPRPTNALVFNLFYDDLAAYLADQLTVLGDGRFSYQEGQIVRRPDDTGWRYMLEAASYFTPPGAPDQAVLLAGLSDNRAEAVIATVAYEDWVHRVDPAVAGLKAAGFWAQPHAWVSVFVPASRAAEFATFVTSQLTPPDIGAGLAIYFPIATAKLTRPLLIVPRSEPAAFRFDLLRFPFPFPGQPSNEAMLAQNRAFFDKAVELGGNRYIIGAVPNMSAADWQRHYGAVLPFFQQAKAAHDPNGILTPGQHIFG